MTAPLGNTKEKCLLLFGFARDCFFLEKGKDIFLWCSALNASGSVAGLQCGLGFAKTIFWGKGFGKTSAESSRPQKGVWGMNVGGFLGFWRGVLASPEQK